MKLALISYLHGAGGAERQIILLANEMAKRGHHVYLVVLCENKSQYDIAKEINVIDLTKVETSLKFNVINRFCAFKKTIEDIRPDITINYNIQGAYFSLLTGKKICGKVLYSERGDPYDKEYSGFRKILRDITCANVDALVFQSEGAKNFFKINKNQKSIVIHNSVTVPQDKFPIAEKRDNRIVTVGRLHPQKNPWLLIDSFALIAERYPNISLEFYGDGDLREQLQNKIDTLKLSDRIHIYASRKDIFSCIRTARLFVLSSDFEGMPNALMEAMALGLPCIAADCRPGGARTLIDNMKNGIIVPVRNPKAMAEKISWILDNPLEAETLANNARMLGVTHTNKVVFDMWDNFLKTV